MTTRRSLLAGAAAATVAAAAFPAGAATPAAGVGDLAPRAARFIEERGRQVIAVVNGPGTVEERRDAVIALLRDTVDIRNVAQFVLGRHWRTATEAQRAEYLRLFDAVLVRNLSARFGEIAGADFTVARNQMASAEEAVVSTIITRPNAPSVALDWRVAFTSGAPRVVDVVAEGTSLRITQRSEYGAVVQRGGGIEGLLQAMRQQLAQLEQAQQR